MHTELVFLESQQECAMPDVTCSRCGQTRAGFERPPFPGAIGARVQTEICQDCWSQWTRQQMMLINHYGLNLMDPQARSFLTKNMEAFLFKTGGEEDVDTTKKGTITW
jgi:Fe-S cluster biosynthesis and repair protein YggX